MYQEASKCWVILFLKCHCFWSAKVKLKVETTTSSLFQWTVLFFKNFRLKNLFSNYVCSDIFEGANYPEYSESSPFCGIYLCRLESRFPSNSPVSTYPTYGLIFTRKNSCRCPFRVPIRIRILLPRPRPVTFLAIQEFLAATTESFNFFLKFSRISYSWCRLCSLSLHFWLKSSWTLLYIYI